jgi:uncharacterized membrane protein YqjE
MSTAAQPTPPAPPVEEPTIGRLVADASRDFSTLIRSEIELAKAELKISARAGGMGAAFLAVAGLLGLLALILISIAFAYFLTMTGMHPAWAFLIVCVVYLIIAGIFAAIGLRKVKQVRAPERAITEAQKSRQLLPGQ